MPLQRIRVPSWDPNRFPVLDMGGEATIYKMKEGLLGKVYHLPSDPLYAERPALKKAAEVRIKEIQDKLPAFPENVPSCIVAPAALLVTPKDTVLGYLMRQVSGRTLGTYTRKSAALSIPSACAVLEKLHDALSEVHRAGIIVGDLNENNVMLENGMPFFIDADSMQYGSFICKSYTALATDPAHLKASRNSQGLPEFALVQNHTELSDWYGFLVIAMRLLVLTDPFGGECRGEDLVKRIQSKRTIFDKKVAYPRTVARPLSSLPREIVEIFWAVFQEGNRFIPDRALFKARQAQRRRNTKMEKTNV